MPLFPIHSRESILRLAAKLWYRRELCCQPDLPFQGQRSMRAYLILACGNGRDKNLVREIVSRNHHVGTTAGRWRMSEVPEERRGWSHGRQRRAAILDYVRESAAERSRERRESDHTRSVIHMIGKPVDHYSEEEYANR